MNAFNPLAPSAEADARSAEPSMEEILASIRRIIADDQLVPARPEQPAAPLRLDEAPIPMRRAEPAPSEHAAPERGRPEAAEAVPTPFAREPQVDGAERPASPPRLAAVAHGQIAPQFPMPDRAPAVDAEHPGDGVHRIHPSVIAPDAWAARPAEPAAGHAGRADAGSGPRFAGEVDASSRAGAPRPAPPVAELFSAHTNQSVSSAFNVLAATRLADNSEELLGLAREMIRPLLKSWLDDNLPTMVERLVRAEIERVARGGR